jgi:hypothetical protein
MPKIAKMFDLGDRARCGAVTNSNESSSQAFASSTPFAPDQGTNALLSLGERTPVSITSLLPGNSEVFGVHSLLDLLFLIVFESFEAVKVWTVP